ncbi:MAG: hypothetical protein ACLRVT_01135 [Oscillospiraceae bacterium]
MLDTSVEVQKNPDYIKTHNLKDGDSTIKALKKESLNRNIEEICANETSLILKDKGLIELQHKTCEVVKKFKDIEVFKFETIDRSKREINSLKESFEQCFKSRTKSFFSLLLKTRYLLFSFSFWC